MNAVHELLALVARDQGYSEDVWLEIVGAPGTAQMSSDHGAMQDPFHPEAVFNLLQV